MKFDVRRVSVIVFNKWNMIVAPSGVAVAIEILGDDSFKRSADNRPGIFVVVLWLLCGARYRNIDRSNARFWMFG